MILIFKNGFSNLLNSLPGNMWEFLTGEGDATEITTNIKITGTVTLAQSITGDGEYL